MKINYTATGRNYGIPDGEHDFDYEISYFEEIDALSEILTDKYFGNLILTEQQKNKICDNIYSFLMDLDDLDNIEKLCADELADYFASEALNENSKG